MIIKISIMGCYVRKNIQQLSSSSVPGCARQYDVFSVSVFTLFRIDIVIKDTENDHDQLKLSRDIEVASLELLPKNIVYELE